MNKFVKVVDKDELINEFITSINGILDLPNRELQLLMEFIKLDMQYDKKSPIPKNIANTANRKYIMNKYGITRDNLSTYIRRLRERGYLIKKDPDELFVNPCLIPIVIKDRVQVTVILKLKDNV